jgi:hypothetical protein
VRHREGQHFEVETSRFRVEVIGTRFTVDAEGVRTERGLVRVVTLVGGEAHDVHPGEIWHFASRPVANTVVMAPARGAVATPPAEATRARVAPAAAPESSSPAAAVPGAGGSSGLDGDVSASARLVRARRALARGDAPGARSAVTPVFGLDRRVAVEARALYAESFLVEGRYTDAVEAFRIVARDFRESRQAETALYAIAQLESEHGEAAQARGALQTYLARYPRGRFVREASERLAALPTSRRSEDP